MSGVRFESRGQGPNVTFRAKDLWRTAEDGISVTLKLHDLSELEWNSEGRVRNQTKWLDSSNLNVSVFKGEDRLDTQREKEDAGVGGFSVQFTMQPIQVDKAVLYGGIIPMSLGEPGRDGERS